MTMRNLVSVTRIATFVLLATVAVADDDGQESAQHGEQFVSVGQLVEQTSPTGQATRYALVDESGKVLARLKSAVGVNLGQFHGHEVGVTARTLVDGEVPVLLAETVTSFGRLEAGPRGAVAPAAYAQEEILPEGAALPIPDGTTIQYEPMLETPILSEGYVPGATCDSCGTVGCRRRTCGLPGKFWVRAEYLIWWTEGMQTPPLVTTSPPGTPAGNAGVLGTPGVDVLYGGEEILSDQRSGGRFRIGTWRDDAGYFGYETDFFFLADEDQNFAATTIGPQIIARPFFNVEEGQDSQLIQYPGIVHGTVQVDADTSLWSISPRLRWNLACEQMIDCDPYYPGAAGGYRLDFLLGYRYVGLEDQLSIRESIAHVDGNTHTYFQLHDSFETSNDFHGADLGILWEGYRGPWSLEMIGRVGVGNTTQEVTISGATSVTDTGPTFTDPGGLLALPSNIGTYSRDEFSVVPEFSITLGYAMTPRSRFLVGYTFMYWDNVVRAGDIIDTTVNQSLLPAPQGNNPARPSFAFSDTDFWAQGLSLGLDYRW